MALAAAMQMGAATSALANDKLIELSKSNENWVMPGKNYDSNNYSEMTQVNLDNVKQLKHAWSFSTGELHGHEGAPLVVGDVMYVHSSFPNKTFALDLNDTGRAMTRRLR
jgi:methanol dehydrogenase (cytochrome c) subunit 1